MNLYEQDCVLKRILRLILGHVTDVNGLPLSDTVSGTAQPAGAPRAEHLVTRASIRHGKLQLTAAAAIANP